VRDEKHQDHYYPNPGKGLVWVCLLGFTN